MDKVGKDGGHHREEGQSGLEKEYTEGMQFDRGYISAYFVTNPDRLEASSAARSSHHPTKRSQRPGHAPGPREGGRLGKPR
jgi:hypothetical protein